MARGNARREAYTAGGKAPLMSLEILNDDAFIVVSVGAAPEAPPTASVVRRAIMTPSIKPLQ